MVALHLFEVNFLDQRITTWIGRDFASIFLVIEDTIMAQMPTFWHPFSIGFFVIIYIAIYPFTLWFTLLYTIIAQETTALRTLAYGLLFMYLLALPFYLFFPVSNVYTYLNISSALETIIPGVEQFFYTTTTSNNCFPSLHTAMTILIAYVATKTSNHRLILFTRIIAILVIISVLYLAIHWILDIIAGILIATGVIFILQRWFEDSTHDFTIK
ncbi:MAG: phosphatase PAP2 family protein [Candidatus Thermoplasmatota archaeon]|nr:phosphatase PAP2 family protein [Candidatus Thermoplasmatota archaeon]